MKLCHSAYNSHFAICNKIYKWKALSRICTNCNLLQIPSVPKGYPAQSISSALIIQIWVNRRHSRAKTSNVSYTITCISYLGDTYGLGPLQERICLSSGFLKPACHYQRFLYLSNYNPIISTCILPVFQCRHLHHLNPCHRRCHSWPRSTQNTSRTLWMWCPLMPG